MYVQFCDCHEIEECKELETKYYVTFSKIETPYLHKIL